MRGPTDKNDPTSFDLTWSSEGIGNPDVEASLKNAVVAALNSEVAKGISPRTPTGFPREIKINVRVVWPAL